MGAVTPPRVPRSRLAVSVALVAMTALAGAAASGGAARAQPHRAASVPRLTLDHVEVDNGKATTLFTPGWSKLDQGSTSATFESSFHGTRGDYSWSIPTTIVSTGTDATISATATDTTGNRMYAYIGVSGDAGEGLPVELHADADKASGNPVVTTTKTFKITPGAPLLAGEFVAVRVDLGPDGPGIYYFYKRAGSKRKRTKISFGFDTESGGQRSERPHRSPEAKGVGKLTIEALSGGKYKVVDAEALITVSRGDQDVTLVAAPNGKNQFTSRPSDRSVHLELKGKHGRINGCDEDSRGSLTLTDVDGEEPEPPVRHRVFGRDGLVIACGVVESSWGARGDPLFVQIDKP
jgi:hypothetical protein